MASGDVNIQTEKEVPPPLKSGIGEPKKTGYKFPHVFFPYKSRYRSPHRRKCRDTAEMRQGLRASVRRGGRELRDHLFVSAAARSRRRERRRKVDFKSEGVHSGRTEKKWIATHSVRSAGRRQGCYLEV
ncbi:hypothetical protein TGARI_370290 [Toxoplasma gondii ARI]|uniref:Uncharacterized protein n=1 Tax=Toxoplasma gondii ARI TaxID=1074872 RepID=A0A139XWB8_TOXGO|nr:hypothetical protein TGARI_370290 [Toxoplasma gondii ARI]